MALDPPPTKPISYVPPQIFTQAETDFFVHFAVHLNVDRLSRTGTKSKFYEALASHPQSQRSSLGWKRHYEQNKDALEQRIKTAYEQHHGEPEPKLNNGVRTDFFTLDEDQLLVQWLGDRPASASVEQAIRDLAKDPKSGTRNLTSWKSHYREHKTTFQSLVANYRRDGPGELPNEPVSYRNKVPASVALRAAAAAQERGRRNEQSSRGSSDNTEGPTGDADSLVPRHSPAPPVQAPVAAGTTTRPPAAASSRTEYQAIMHAASNVQTPQTPNVTVSFPNPPAVRIQLPSQSTSQLAVVNRDRTRSPVTAAPPSRSLRARNRNPRHGEGDSETAEAENETSRRSTRDSSKRARLRKQPKPNDASDSDSEYQESHRSDSEESDSASDCIPEPLLKRRRVVSSESPAQNLPLRVHPQAAVPVAIPHNLATTSTAGWFSDWQRWMHHTGIRVPVSHWQQRHGGSVAPSPILRPPAVPVVAPDVAFAPPLEPGPGPEVPPVEEMPSTSQDILEVRSNPENAPTPADEPRNTTPHAFDLETFLFGDDDLEGSTVMREMDVVVDASPPLRMPHTNPARAPRQNALPLFFAPQCATGSARSDDSMVPA
uniref:Uncharacterized protein n=1 Tax=Mycena chlorophos TaxID=658473 RepID=A0ABQ0LHB5_MYCCL|nr:predicted protein [Mycena chlorophos]